MSLLPLSPTVAAMLGQLAPPAATMGPGAALPSTPVAPMVGAMGIPTSAAGSPFSSDPMADFLLQRANRPGPMISGFDLLGRLAALGVGTKRDRDAREGAYQSQVARLEALGVDPAMAAVVASGDLSLKDAIELSKSETAKPDIREFNNDLVQVMPGGEIKVLAEGDEPTPDTVVIADPTSSTGRRIVKKSEAIGREAPEPKPLIQQNLGGEIAEQTAKQRAKAETEKQIGMEQARPVMETYLTSLEGLSDALASGDLNAISAAEFRITAQRGQAGEALARLRQPTGILTDEDIGRALRDIPSPLSIRNALSGGRAFRTQMEAFREIIGLDQPGQAGFNPDTASEEELDAFLNANP